MPGSATFLHLTDAHVSAAGESYLRDDRKTLVGALPPETREAALGDALGRLAEHLKLQGDRLDGVLFSGDAQSRGAPGGHELVFDLLIKYLGPLGIAPGRIVATPGNHDVPQGAKPSSRTRYRSFTKVWRDAGCVVPWLDGIDQAVASSDADLDRHRLEAEDRSWAIFPVNTSNWSHAPSILPAPLRDVWDLLPGAVAGGDAARASKIAAQLAGLARYDMARISAEQLEVLRKLLQSTARPASGRQLRIAVMHHHLRSPSLREELKPFPDISNLEQVRAMLEGGGIDVVVHGHKHEHAVYFEHVYSSEADEQRRLLVVSGATFEPGRERDAMRLIRLQGLPHVPSVSITPLPLPRPGAGWKPGPEVERRLWVQNARSSDPVQVVQGAPVVIEGRNIDEVYARACAAAASDARRGALIVHLDLPSEEKAVPLPSGYPDASQDPGARADWLRDLVDWWQRDRSQLEHRIPYVHGARLRRYGGKIDQIKRVIELLRMKESTRALAILVDPFRDFQSELSQEEFASFCLVEFRRRSSGMDTFVDAIAFYRAQEFTRWWPINVGELRLLQVDITAALGFRPGRITTIAADARTIARSPTQVAMPIIDRWLDQAPERLHLLADALVHPANKGEAHGLAIAEWQRTLEELRVATKAFNADGVPVAIEGLRTLAAYLRASAGPADDEVLMIAALAHELANQNESYERTGQQKADFDLWAPDARRRVDELDAKTGKRFAA